MDMLNNEVITLFHRNDDNTFTSTILEKCVITSTISETLLGDGKIKKADLVIIIPCSGYKTAWNIAQGDYIVQGAVKVEHDISSKDIVNFLKVYSPVKVESVQNRQCEYLSRIPLLSHLEVIAQ